MRDAKDHPEREALYVMVPSGDPDAIRQAIWGLSAKAAQGRRTLQNAQTFAEIADVVRTYV